MPIPNRSRNKNGTFRKKRSDTHLGSLRKVYDGSVPKGRPDKHLGTVLKQKGQKSLSDLLNKNND